MRAALGLYVLAVSPDLLRTPCRLLLRLPKFSLRRCQACNGRSGMTSLSRWTGSSSKAPDDSRGRTWLADQGLEIVTTDRGEVARRKDGARFRSVRFRMSPTYSVLPKEYAPFSPFGDGGMLFPHRPFLRVSGPLSRGRIVVDGSVGGDRRSDRPRRQSAKAQAHWIDRNDGRVVYVGKNVPQQTDDFIAVLDATLPQGSRGQLLEQLPGSCTYSLESSAPTDTSHALRLLRRIPSQGMGSTRRRAARSGLHPFLRRQVACRDGKAWFPGRTCLAFCARGSPHVSAAHIYDLGR